MKRFSPWEHPPSNDRPAAWARKYFQHQRFCLRALRISTAIIGGISQAMCRARQFFYNESMVIEMNYCATSMSMQRELVNDCHLLILSCMPDDSALLNHSQRDPTMTRCALNVCTLLSNSLASPNWSLRSFGEAGAPPLPITSNSISVNWPEWSKRSAFFDNELCAAFGDSHRYFVKFICNTNQQMHS